MKTIAKRKQPLSKPKETQEEYRQRVMSLICDLLANGKTLRSICQAVEGMPNIATVMRWLGESKELCEQYARARQLQADFYADEIIDIADTEPDPQVARIRTDVRKWHASKTSPKKYGDKITHSGDEENPIKVINKIERVVIKPQ